MIAEYGAEIDKIISENPNSYIAYEAAIAAAIPVVKTFKENLSANKIIGIKEIEDYLQEKITLAKTKELITQKTRQYAKRQFTWYRGHMKSWEMIYSQNINDLFKKALNKIS